MNQKQRFELAKAAMVVLLERYDKKSVVSTRDYCDSVAYLAAYIATQTIGHLEEFEREEKGDAA